MPNGHHECIDGNIAGVGPNGTIDAMANTAFHELAEAVTDPDIDAWQSAAEIGDLCAWKYSGVFTAPNGAIANFQNGSTYYLLQQLWVNDARGYCAVQRKQPGILTETALRTSHSSVVQGG